MPDPHDRYRKPEDVGSESPAGGEAKEQRVSGERGGPQERRPRGRVSPQPPQGSGRRSAKHQQEPTERKSFPVDEDRSEGGGPKGAGGRGPSRDGNPAEQGEGEPRPDRLKARSREQGIEPRSGSHRAHGERTEERAQQGPPAEGHTRHGRQRVPGRPQGPDGGR